MAEAPALDLAGTTVLIVEDHDDSQDMMRQIVESFGATVHVAEDGQHALKAAQAKRPDLIFCDLLMPGLDGWAFLQRLREIPRLCRVPVIAVSALGSPADVRNTWDSGFNGHLIKPVTYEIVSAQLERMFWAHPHAERQTAAAAKPHPHA
jgi:two-component system CheB/CheR fusion protein